MTKCYLDTVGAPAPLVGGLGDVGLQLGRQLWQVQENVLGGAQDWCCDCELALGIDQVCGVEQVAAAVTLIASSILRAMQSVYGHNIKCN